MAKFDIRYTAKGVSLKGKADAASAESVVGALADAVVTPVAERKPRKAKAGKLAAEAK